MLINDVSICDGFKFCMFHTWRSGVRSAMHAASQLPGRGPTDVDFAPVPAC